MKRYFLLFALLVFINPLNAQTSQITFKQGKGLKLLAADSSAFNSLNVWFQPYFSFQKALEKDTDWVADFGVQRARFNFIGWLKNPKFGYHLQLQFAPNEVKTGTDATARQEGYGPKMMLDGAIKWKFHPNFQLWFGQENVSATYEGHYAGHFLQLVNKSNFHSTFNYNRELGVQLRGSFGKLFVIRPHFGWTMGDGQNIVTGNQGGFQYLARIEVLPFGKFAGNDNAMVDLLREPKPKLGVAATLDFNHRAVRQSGNSGKFVTDAEGNLQYANVSTFIVDAMFKYQGISALGAFAVRTAGGNNPAFREAGGFHLQAGYLLDNNYEVAIRYGLVEPTGEDNFAGTRECTIGISKYLSGHFLKIQSDVGLIRNSTAEVTTLRYRFQITAGF